MAEAIRTPAVMIQGCGSNVGKSLLVAGLCRHFARAGLNVRPFKPQNMSNNAAVTVENGEIGRAQALQARAAGIPPSIHMNPVLLKPETDRGSQVVVQGQRLTRAEARDYLRLKSTLLPAVLDSYARIAAEADLVLVEGAGSPAEVNLRAGDIANMGFAEAAGVPVILAGDIDRGGVIAQLAGTHRILSPQDAGRIRGFLINKFRGDPTLFDDGLAAIVAHTGWPALGVLPWFAGAHLLPAEDAADIPERSGDGPFRIVAPRISRIANFDDLDPLSQEPGVTVEITPPGKPLPDADLILLPGAKSTRGDLAFLREQGWDIDILRHHRLGGRIHGICGGYQMLGTMISDPQGIEGPPGETPGLGLLDVTTVMTPRKALRTAEGTHIPTGAPFTGYEIHIGETTGPDCARPQFRMAGRTDGAASVDGRVTGGYIHGQFASDAFRRTFLSALGAPASTLAYDRQVEATLDALADHVAAHLDTEAILSIARAPHG